MTRILTEILILPRMIGTSTATVNILKGTVPIDDNTMLYVRIKLAPQA